jgi:hypothetical protein
MAACRECHSRLVSFTHPTHRNNVRRCAGRAARFELALTQRDNISTMQEPTGRVTTLAGVDLKVRTSAGEERHMACKINFNAGPEEGDGAALLKPGETWKTTVVMGPCWLRESDEVIDVWVEYGGDLRPYKAPHGVEDFAGYRAQSDGMTIDVRNGKVLKRWRPPALRAKRHGE